MLLLAVIQLNTFFGGDVCCSIPYIMPRFIHTYYISVFQLVCQSRSPGVLQKISEKNYLGTSKFAAFLCEIWRERKSMSACGNLLFFRDHHDFGTKIEISLTDFK